MSHVTIYHLAKLRASSSFSRRNQGKILVFFLSFFNHFGFLPLRLKGLAFFIVLCSTKDVFHTFSMIILCFFSFKFLQFIVQHGYQRFNSCIRFIEIVQGFWEEDDSSSPFLPSMLGIDLFTMLANIVLHNFLFTSNLLAMGFDLGYWVKLQNRWFFMFLLIEYDEKYQTKNFQMSKSALVKIANQLGPLIAKNATYHLAIPHVEVQVICVIYKRSHSSNLLTYNELFVRKINGWVGFAINCQGY